MSQQQKLKKLFQLSFFTLLMVASLLVISGGEQQQSFSQPSEQDTNSATTTQSTDFLTYDNATYGITIQYPSDWKVQEFKQSQSAKRGQSTTYHEIAGFVSPKLSITDQSNTEWVVISIEELGDNMTLDQYLAYTVALYNGSEVYPSSQVVSYSDDDLFLTSRNYPAYQVENTYYSVQTDSQNRAIEVGTIIEGKAYIISYRGDDKAEFSQFLPIVQQMIDSFDVFESKRT